MKPGLTGGSALGAALAYFGAMGILTWGLLHAPHGYADPHFVVDYLSTELQAAAWLLVCTLTWFRPAAIGLRWPQWQNWQGLVPLALLVAVYGAKWGATQLWSTPAQASADIAAHRILITTLAVGLTEEWMCRGLLLAVCSAWLGLHRGAALSLVLFGALHLLNVAGGQSVAAVAIQSVMAALTGAVLLLAALSTRSLLVPVLGHGLYDFFTIDAARFIPTDETSLLTLAALPVGPLLGLYSLYRLHRWPAGSPYPVTSVAT